MRPVVVLKLGGAAMASGASLDGFASEVSSLAERGFWPVVVHGGGPALTAMLKRLGVASEFVDGHRVTSPEAAEVAQMVLSGRINQDIVGTLNRAGAAAIGLSGTDGGMIQVRKHEPNGRDIGRVGLVTRVDVKPLLLLLESGYTPVVSSTATGADGQPFNVNADVVAGAVAGALRAQHLVFLSDVDGVVVDGEMLPEIDPARARELLSSGVASGGMRPKLEAALIAFEHGVEQIYLLDGRAPGVVLSALFDGPVSGTTLTSAASSAGIRRLA